MKVRFFVLGSCYSGYCFKEKLLGNLASNHIEKVYQHQHDSLISIMTKKVSVPWENATSKYQWDYNHFAKSIFEKDVLQKIIDAAPDYLLFDTYAEAVCPIIQVEEETYLTSNYYVQPSSVYEQIPKLKILSVEDESRKALFRKYVKEFFGTLKEALPEMKIILVRARATSELYNGEDKGLSWFGYEDKVYKMNNRWEAYDRIVLEEVENVQVLDMRDEYLPAATDIYDQFSYEISHNHYAVDYYRKQYGRIKNIILENLLGKEPSGKFFRQAVCIMADKDFELLMLQAKIYKDFFMVYIHVDRDAVGKSISVEQIAALRKIPNVTVMVKYRAPKGSYNELQALLEITRSAFCNPNIHMVHYMTNYDMPIRPINQIYDFFEQQEGISYLNLHANGNREDMQKVEEYTCKYYYYDYNSDETDALVKEMRENQIALQKKNGVRRNGMGEFQDTYKGVLGGCISREAFEYTEQYCKEHPEYVEDIKYSRLRCEFYLHTILFNKEEWKEKIKGGPRGALHDWIWDDKKKDYAELNIEQYQKLRNNPKTLFVRNVTSKAKEVMERICRDIKTPYLVD